MANPNIVAVTGVYAGTDIQNITTSATAIVTCPTGKVIKINSLTIANIDGSTAADVTVDLYRSSTAYKLLNTVSVPADSSLVAISKDSMIYLLEGDAIRLTASANSFLTGVISYETIS